MNWLLIRISCLRSQHFCLRKNNSSQWIWWNSQTRRIYATNFRNIFVVVLCQWIGDNSAYRRKRRKKIHWKHKAQTNGAIIVRNAHRAFFVCGRRATSQFHNPNTLHVIFWAKMMCYCGARPISFERWININACAVRNKQMRDCSLLRTFVLAN